MKFLPEECLREIFAYLSGTEILALTQVCRLFHNIINTSPSLSSKLTLCFEKHKHYNRMGRRKYRNLIVEYLDPSIHYNILRFIGCDITRLTFYNYHFKIDSIRQALVLCQKLKFLKFENIQRLHAVQDLSGSAVIPNYQDVELTIVQCDPRIFKILRNCQVTKLTFNCCEFAHRKHFLDFVQFLKVQERLVDLTLAEFNGPFVGMGLVLFQDATLCDVKFKLKKLVLQNNDLSPYGNILSVTFFEDFLNLHQGSLESFTANRLLDIDFTRFIKDCKLLKDLSVSDDLRLSSKQTFLPIESLQVSNFRMSILRTCPNIQRLSITKNCSSQVKWSLLDNCQFIETLEIVNLPLEDVPNIPSLRILRLGNIRHLKSEIFARNKQIEELTIRSCRDIGHRKNKVLKIIVGYLKDLVSLTFIGCSRIDDPVIDYVKEMCPKLKYLRVIAGDE